MSLCNILSSYRFITFSSYFYNHLLLFYYYCLTQLMDLNVHVFVVVLTFIYHQYSYLISLLRCYSNLGFIILLSVFYCCLQFTKFCYLLIKSTFRLNWNWNYWGLIQSNLHTLHNLLF